MKKSAALFASLKSHLESQIELGVQAFEQGLQDWMSLRMGEMMQVSKSTFKHLKEDLDSDRYVKLYGELMVFFCASENFFPKVSGKIEEHLGIKIRGGSIRSQKDLMQAFEEIRAQVVNKNEALDAKTMVVSDEVIDTCQSLTTWVDLSPDICSSSSIGTIKKYLKDPVLDNAFPLTLVMRFLHAQKEERAEFAEMLVNGFPKDISEANSLYLEIVAMGAPQLLQLLSERNIRFYHSSDKKITPLEVVASLDEFLSEKSSLQTILSGENFLKIMKDLDWELQQGLASIRGYSRLQVYSTTKTLLQMGEMPNQNALEAGFRCFNYPFLVPCIESLKQSQEGQEILNTFFQGLCVAPGLQVPDNLLPALAKAVARWVGDLPSFAQWLKNDPKKKLSILGEKLVPILSRLESMNPSRLEDIFHRLDCIELTSGAHLFSIEKFQEWLSQDGGDSYSQEQLQLFIYTALNLYQDHEALAKWLRANFSSSFQPKPGTTMSCLAHMDVS